SAGSIPRPADLGASRVVLALQVRVVHPRGTRPGRIIAGDHAGNAHRVTSLGANRCVALVRGETNIRRLPDAVSAFVKQIAVHVLQLQHGIIDLDPGAIHSHAAIRVVELLNETLHAGSEL